MNPKNSDQEQLSFWQNCQKAKGQEPLQMTYPAQNYPAQNYPAQHPSTIINMPDYDPSNLVETIFKHVGSTNQELGKYKQQAKSLKEALAERDSLQILLEQHQSAYERKLNEQVTNLKAGLIEQFKERAILFTAQQEQTLNATLTALTAEQTKTKILEARVAELEEKLAESKKSQPKKSEPKKSEPNAWMKNMDCKFGSDCKRKGCNFKHPDSTSSAPTLTLSADLDNISVDLDNILPLQQ